MVVVLPWDSVPVKWAFEFLRWWSCCPGIQSPLNGLCGLRVCRGMLSPLNGLCGLQGCPGIRSPLNGLCGLRVCPGMLSPLNGLCGLRVCLGMLSPLNGLCGGPDSSQAARFTLHSCKAKSLDWAAQLGLSVDLRAAQRHHRLPNHCVKKYGRDDV